MTRYARFFLMIATSAVVMFFLMYLNSYRIADHFWFSETRLFMTLIMAAGMMVVMLSFMLGMYPNHAANAGIYAAAAVLFAVALYLVRTQGTVNDQDYMEGMIPHHSIAVLTSERARIADPRVRELADGIIASQQREIREMEWLIADIQANGPARTPAEAAKRRVPDLESGG